MTPIPLQGRGWKGRALPGKYWCPDTKMCAPPLAKSWLRAWVYYVWKEAVYADGWLPVLIASMVWRCLLGLAPLYLRELCCPLHSAVSSRSLRLSQQVFFWSRLLEPPLSREVLFSWWVP